MLQHESVQREGWQETGGVGFMLFRDLCERWKIECRLGGAASWKATQDGLLKDHISPFIGHKKVAEITHFDISNILISSRNRGLSIGTLNHLYLLLNRIFSDAIEYYECIDRSPVRKKYHKPKLIKKEQDFLKPFQAWVLLEYAMTRIPFGIAVWIQIFTGLRVGEVQGLKWSDIDFENDIIFVKRKYNRHTQKLEEWTKNGTQHRVPMAPPLKEFLQKYRKNEGFVCATANGSVMAYYGYNTYIRRLCKKLNFPIRASHGLRHTCAVLWVTIAGATEKDIRDLFNHKSSKSTETYMHAVPERLAMLAKRLKSGEKTGELYFDVAKLLRAI